MILTLWAMGFYTLELEAVGGFGQTDRASCFSDLVGQPASSRAEQAIGLNGIIAQKGMRRRKVRPVLSGICACRDESQTPTTLVCRVNGTGDDRRAGRSYSRPLR